MSISKPRSMVDVGFCCPVSFINTGNWRERLSLSLRAPRVHLTKLPTSWWQLFQDSDTKYESWVKSIGIFQLPLTQVDAWRWKLLPFHGMRSIANKRISVTYGVWYMRMHSWQFDIMAPCWQLFSCWKENSGSLVKRDFDLLRISLALAQRSQRFQHA